VWTEREGRWGKEGGKRERGNKRGRKEV